MQKQLRQGPPLRIGKGDDFSFECTNKWLAADATNPIFGKFSHRVYRKKPTSVYSSREI